MVEPGKKEKRKKLKDKLFELKNARRSGEWVADLSAGALVKAGKKEQRQYKRGLSQKIKEVRAGR